MSWGPNAWPKQCINQDCKEIFLLRFSELVALDNPELAKYCPECRDLFALGEEILDGSTRLMVKENE